MRGDAGRRVTERDSRGEVVREEVVEESTPGKSVQLWVDSTLQRALSSAMKQSLDRLGVEKGAAVALDVDTGGIRALVSYPRYNANIFSAQRDNERIQELLSSESRPLFNRVTSGQYPTGSTIKPLVASAALEEDVIDPRTQIDANKGYIEVQHQYDEDTVYRFNDWKKHGWVDMREAIAVSSNVYFYTIGGGHKEQEGLGASRLQRYLHRFGWGSTTGVDIPNERSGFIPDPVWKKRVLGEAWYIGNTYHLSIGQGYLRTTPLQLAVSTAAIANGGDLYSPRAARAILNQEKEVVRTIQPRVTQRDIIQDEHLAVAREGMREAVEYGSSEVLQGLPVKVAAKTGTAETPRDGVYHHWVTVFAPYDDPEVALTVLVEDVEGLQSATLPVAQTALQAYFSK